MAAARLREASEPPTAARRAGPAQRRGVAIAAAAPADAAALAPKSQGSPSRAAFHTGIAVSATSVPVYVASGGPARNETAAGPGRETHRRAMGYSSSSMRRN
jgi:hypothetical protein